MLDQPYYLLRSKTTGQYLVARPFLPGRHPEEPTDPYLLLFVADFDALSYLNTHAGEFASQFAIEQGDSQTDQSHFSALGL